MIEKTCTACGIVKPLEEYARCNRVKDGREARCKSCRKEYRDSRKDKCKEVNNAYYNRNKESILDKQKVYYDENKEQYARASKIWRNNNKEKKSLADRVYRDKNKERLNAQSREYHHKNYISKPRPPKKDKDTLFLERQKRWAVWYDNNKERVAINKKTYRNNSLYYIIDSRMRGLVLRILNLTGTKKNHKTYDILGYTKTDLIEHFKSGKYSYDDLLKNKKLYHIDHIIPVSFFISKLKENYTGMDVLNITKKCNSLENLRIITAHENLIKSDKLCLPLINKYKLYHLLT